MARERFTSALEGVTSAIRKLFSTPQSTATTSLPIPHVAKLDSAKAKAEADADLLSRLQASTRAMDEDFTKMPWLLREAAKADPLAQEAKDVREEILAADTLTPKIEADTAHLCGRYTTFIHNGGLAASIAKEQALHRSTLTFCEQLNVGGRAVARNNNGRS